MTNLVTTIAITIQVEMCSVVLQEMVGTPLDTATSMDGIHSMFIVDATHIVQLAQVQLKTSVVHATVAITEEIRFQPQPASHQAIVQQASTM